MTIKRNSGILSSIIIFMFVAACSGIDQGEISCVVKPIRLDSGTIDLQFLLTSTRPRTILVDHDALSLFTSHPESDELNQAVANLQDVVSKIEHAQFVIENTRHDRRFFSDVKLFEGERIQMKSVFQLEPPIDSITLSANKIQAVFFRKISVNRLRILPDDHEIRLIYLFRPTIEQAKRGLSDEVFYSNWFKIDD